ncbi:MAG: hypothetical protein GY730_08565 [bacterium]|nr:hypothetical protein [bacterium]
MKRILSLAFVLFLAITATLTAKEDLKHPNAIKFYPIEIIDTTGTIEFEARITTLNSSFKSLETRLQLEKENQDINIVFGFGDINYKPDKEWRIFSKNKYDLSGGYSKYDTAINGIRKSGSLGLGYSNYLGIEKSIIDRISIGAEARLFYLYFQYEYLTSSASRGRLNMELFDSFKLYFKVDI